MLFVIPFDFQIGMLSTMPRNLGQPYFCGLKPGSVDCSRLEIAPSTCHSSTGPSSRIAAIIIDNGVASGDSLFSFAHSVEEAVQWIAWLSETSFGVPSVTCEI